MEEEKKVEFFTSKTKVKKIETIEAWIKSDIVKNKGVWCFLYYDSKNEVSCNGFYEELNDKYRIELSNLLELLEWIYDENYTKNLILHCESLYVINCVGEWIEKWKRNNFLISEGIYRPHTDLLQKIIKYKEKINISFQEYNKDNNKAIEEIYKNTVESIV